MTVDVLPTFDLQIIKSELCTLGRLAQLMTALLIGIWFFTHLICDNTLSKCQILEIMNALGHWKRKVGTLFKKQNFLWAKKRWTVWIASLITSNLYFFVHYSIIIFPVTLDDRFGASPPPRLLFPGPVEHSGLHCGQRSSGGLRLLVSRLLV